MCLKNIIGYTHAALIAMLELVPSSHSTDSTFVTMEWAFAKVHPEIALCTMPFCKGDTTRHAYIGT